MSEFKSFCEELAGSDEYRALQISVSEGNERDAGLYAEAISKKIQICFLQSEQEVNQLLQELDEYAQEFLPEWHAVFKKQEATAV